MILTACWSSITLEFSGVRRIFSRGGGVNIAYIPWSITRQAPLSGGGGGGLDTFSPFLKKCRGLCGNYGAYVAVTGSTWHLPESCHAYPITASPISQRIAINRTMDINRSSMANRVLRKLVINRTPFWTGPRSHSISRKSLLRGFYSTALPEGMTVA